MPYCKIKLIAEVYCKNEAGSMLDDYVTPWLNKDLQMMNKSQLIIQYDRDKDIYNWRATVLVVPNNVTGEIVLVLPDVLHMMAADLSFYVYVLGKEGGSGHYCPYCPLTKTQWTAPLDFQPVVELWTLGSWQEMGCDNFKKGRQKLGVKSTPKIEHIEVSEFVVSLTHIGLGVDNTTIVTFEDRAKAHIVKVPPTDHIMQTGLASLDSVIEVSWEELKAFGGTPDGVACQKLAQQQQDTGTSMTADKITLLTSLSAQ